MKDLICLEQGSANCGPRTTGSPRGLPLARRRVVSWIYQLIKLVRIWK